MSDDRHEHELQTDDTPSDHYFSQPCFRCRSTRRVLVMRFENVRPDGVAVSAGRYRFCVECRRRLLEFLEI